LYCQAKLFAVQVIFYVIIKRRGRKKKTGAKLYSAKTKKKENDKCRNTHTHT